MDQISTQTQEHPTWVEIKEMMRESRLQMQIQMQETDKRIKELTEQFTSTTGHISEGLIAPATVKIFQKAGFNIDRSYCNLKKKNKLNQLEMEVDCLLLDDTLVIAVEIKTNCRVKDVDKFLRNMAKFKRLFPEYKDKEVLAAVAALHFDHEAAEHAHEQGLLVIRVSENDVFSLDPHSRAELTRF